MNERSELESEAVDMIVLARFATLPGAARVIQAYSAIPPGRLREASVLQIEAMAETYAGGPQEAQGGFDVPQAAFHVQAPQSATSALPAPPQGRPPLHVGQAETVEMKAVILMLNGMTPLQAAEATGLPVADVLAARKTAQKNKIDFPRVPMTQVVTGEPIPDDGAAPGETRKERKTGKEAKGGGFPVTIKQVKGQGGLTHMRQAAERLGISLDAYFEKRAECLRLVRQGKEGTEIARLIGISDVQFVRNWVTRIKASGLDKDPHAGLSFPLWEQEVTGRGRKPVLDAAEKLGLPLEEYFRKRRRCVQLMQGQKFTESELATDLGVPVATARMWRRSIIILGLDKQAVAA